jgi:hypothetical protein
MRYEYTDCTTSSMLKIIAPGMNSILQMHIAKWHDDGEIQLSKRPKLHQV